jgi:CBS-domain-containing membrane protein
MSPRAACRLAAFGYEVFDYAAGKVDWMAHGLPMDGTAARSPTALTFTRDDVVTCALDDAAEQVQRAIDDSPYGFALALSDARCVLGRVRRSRLAGAKSGDLVEAVLEPGPSTIRPHISVDELRKRLARGKAQTLIVTDPEGLLLGVVRRADVEHAG